MIQLTEVRSKKEWDRFIDLPWEIYEKDNFWVPPLRIAVRDLLDTRKNPFFKHARMISLIAVRDGRTVGRISGIVDDRHNEFHQEKTGFFGFFEVINDQEVANTLLDAVSEWAKKEGMNTLRGPMNPSTNHECGLLVEGFQDTPTVMTTYNPPYYQELLEKWGMKKSKDLYAYNLSKDSPVADRLIRQAERLKKRSSVKFRPVNLSDFENEVKRIHDIYNDAWEKNWGFVPMDFEEFRHLSNEMKLVMDPRLCLIAELDGEAVGFALTLPDVNQAFKKVEDGKLFPTGLAKLLWNLKGPGRKNTINRVRIVTLGVKKAYQELGLGPLFYMEYFKRGPELGFDSGEASWILEDNRPMNRALEMMAGKRSKVYRIYDRPLN